MHFNKDGEHVDESFDLGQLACHREMLMADKTFSSKGKNTLQSVRWKKAMEHVRKITSQLESAWILYYRINCRSSDSGPNFQDESLKAI